MYRRRRLATGSALATAILSFVVPALADDAMTANPVVVELFTSQGCSSCPPAEANLNAISDRPGVLALSFGVTYWDYLGWKDSFAKPEYTTRQYNYERSLHRATAYTPQMVVNGAADLVGDQMDEVEGAIDHGHKDAAMHAAPMVAIANRQVVIGAGSAPEDGADVWLVRYDPSLVEVPVGRGENGGRTLPKKNVVHELTRLGAWSGAAESFDLPAASNGWRTAVLVQGVFTGPILAAATE
jgi:hypothetical protein